jgi:hypothetical protein
MTSSLMTPFEFTAPSQSTRRSWRKKVLPIGSINYKGQHLDFTRDYLSGLVQAFNDHAFDQIPFQLATDDNQHNNNPKNFIGDVAALELADDGLYATVTTTDDGAALLEKNPNLGISARIVNEYARADGKFWKSAIQHVLATLDPRVPGLGPWEAVTEFSSDNSECRIIDMSQAIFQTEATKVPDLTEEEVTAFRAFLAKQAESEKEDKTPPKGEASTEDDSEVLSDAELEALIAAAEADFEDGPEDETEDEGDGDDDRELVSASASAKLAAKHQEAIDLTNAHLEAQAVELARVTEQLDSQRWEAEKSMFSREYSLPPAVLELAKPLLKGEGHTVNLSNGDDVDAGACMRQVLTEVGKLAKLLDLSNELGSGVEGDSSREDEAKARTETTKTIRSALSL